WAQGRVAGAVHMPYAEIARRAPAELPSDANVVVYCWSPGCNAGAKGALAFAELGYRVREMIGGFEYWAREGLPVEDADGVHRRPIDPLTGVPRIRTRA
ncbi:rhodanese-like domain-containing protein, partial [Microbacterium sp.]|uniref:rhodanese-like domain-containing protein n=3 Tax=Microbacterium TaxID=33882 RepID=UPI003F993687